MLEWYDGPLLYLAKHKENGSRAICTWVTQHNPGAPQAIGAPEEPHSMWVFFPISDEELVSFRKGMPLRDLYTMHPEGKIGVYFTGYANTWYYEIRRGDYPEWLLPDPDASLGDLDRPKEEKQNDGR